MNENLQRQYDSTGRLTLGDLALEVAFSGESWKNVCRQAEVIAGARPGVYRRIKRLLTNNGRTLAGFRDEALETVQP